MKSLSKILFVSLILLSTRTEARTSNCEVFTPFPIETFLPFTITIDTISGSKLNFDHWIIQLKPDPFLDGIRIRSTQKDTKFGWSLKTLTGEELASKADNRKEARLNCRFLPKGVYVLELKRYSDVYSVKLLKH